VDIPKLKNDHFVLSHFEKHHKIIFLEKKQVGDESAHRHFPFSLKKKEDEIPFNNSVK
jgi:hypothetical protein